MTAQDLKYSILQLAVQGKLVSQNDSDEPAGELLKRIKAEKEKLVKEGKIKKDKPLPPISEDEIPFVIPPTWEWMRLGVLCQLSDGERRKNIVFPYLEAKYLRGLIEPKPATEGKYVPKGTKLILVDGENSGEVFISSSEGYMGSTFKILFIPNALLDKYVLYFLLLKKEMFRNNKTGSAIPHLNKELFFYSLIPIPPLEEQKRIVAKIEELIPYIEEYGKAEEELSILNEEFPEKLRKSILQLAVQGKLVPQKDSGEPASALLKRIKAEKERLVKEGKIKKDKPLPPVSEDEIPFEIPSTWEWVKINEIANYITKGTTPRGGNVAYKKTGVGFLRAENVGKDGRLHLENLQYIDEETHNGVLQRSILTENDLLVTIAGTLGRTAIVSSQDLPLNANQAISFIRWFDVKDLFIPYIQLAIDSPTIQHIILGKAKATGVPNLTLEIIANTIIPLPPLEEQKRIVARAAELFTICKQLEI